MSGFCYKTATIWQIGGYFVLIVKILIPVLIIIFAMIDLARAIVSNDGDKAIKLKTKIIVTRVIAGIVIFFIPTVVNFVFSLVHGFDNSNGSYMNCVECLTKPNGDCDTSYKGEIFE